MLSKKWRKRVVSLMLSAAILPWNVGSGFVNAAETEGIPIPLYQWDFETIDNNNANNSGSIADAYAVLKGTAKAETVQITVGDQTYSQSGNHVLTLSGGDKGSSYAELPSDLYSKVSAADGLTWSFWMKTDNAIQSYSRVFSSSNASNAKEFAYAPYAKDGVWNLLFDDGDIYRHVYGSEPEKGVWNYITITIAENGVEFYVNGDEVASSCEKGNLSILKARINELSAYTNHALGKTTSTWTDADCAVQLDDVSLYNEALTAEEVAELAKTYGLNPTGPRVMQDAEEGVYNGEKLTQINELTTTSVDGKLEIKIWKDADDAYYYSVSREGKVVIECSALGLTTQKVDLCSGLKLEKDSLQKTSGREEYDLIQGASSHVNKEYAETTFVLGKDNSKVKVYFRAFEDGMAFRYEVDEDTSVNEEKTVITSENSEFSLPDKGKLWVYDTPSVSSSYYTYEPGAVKKTSVEEMYDTEDRYYTPVLASLGEDSGNAWILLSEANVYNEEEPYCASIFKTEKDDKTLQMTFGSYLVQEQDDSYNGKKYSANCALIDNITMTGTFHTPWRVAVITDDLETLTNSSLITDLNPDAEGDYSWVEPGASVWSWWSTTSDSIDYAAMKDYIDLASNADIKYCLVDFGWELWNDYEDKIASLVSYAEDKGVGILLWYGVNKYDGAHVFDLDNEDRIEEAFAWCEKMGVKGVKIDYFNSDSQFAMKTMQLIAKIAAQHKLVVNYHGCTNPNGENRTYPNILSSEAVNGAENFKWGSGSETDNLLTIPYTRNVLGSMEFTPTAWRVNTSDEKAGFHIAMPVVYESAMQTFAASAYVYEGYAGLDFIADVPVSWDESRLLGGYPGESVIRARRSGDNWYIGAMTLDAQTYQVPLDFLDKDTEYTAYIYGDNEDETDLEMHTQKVTSETILDIDLLAKGGCAIKITKNDPVKSTIYDCYDYYEAEKAQLTGKATVDKANYASGHAVVGYIGSGNANAVTFNNVVADRDGEYDLKVYYISGEARNLYIKVNDDDPVKMENLIGISKDWNAVSAKTISIDLKSGENTICLYNDEAYAPNIDRIAVIDTESINNQQLADAVTAKINALGTVTSLESKTAVEEARAAYNALTEAQKARVTNVNVLEAAEAKIKVLEEAGNQNNNNGNNNNDSGNNNPQPSTDGNTGNTGNTQTPTTPTVPTVPTAESIVADNPALPSGTAEDSKSAIFGELKAKVKISKATSNKIQWSKVKGADGYVVFGNKCNSKGRKYAFEVLAIIDNNNTTSYIHTGLAKATYYKYLVQAYKMVDGKVQIISTSKTIHAATKSTKYANVSKLKLNKTNVTLQKKGKTFKVTAKVIKTTGKKLVNHRKVCFESSNPKVATVNSKGVIKAKKKGTCTIYVYAQNGVCQTVKVKVKK